jgi:predicted TIM-barrel fold metal-dependent hydrolase
MASQDRYTLSRREVLKGIAAAATGGALPAGTLFAQSGRGAQGVVDVHQHFTLPGSRGANRDWSVEKVLDLMGKNGISTVIFSNAGNGEQIYAGTEAARDLCRRMNDYLAKMVSDHPKSFGFFAVIPFPDADGSLKELEYVYGTLKADGVGILSSINEKYPGDPLFRPAWEEMNRRKAVTFMHPYTPRCCRTLIESGEASVERDFDTTRAVTNLLYSGTLSQLPDIRYILNHSGADVPVMAGRIKDRVPGASSFGAKKQTDGITPKTPKGVFYELQKLYYECAHAAYGPAIAALRAFVQPTQLLFGSDFPAEDPAETLYQLKQRDLPPDILHALYRGNAERLFPRLKA